MRTSPQGVAEIASHEGVVLSPYKDSVGVWTIGVGHAATSGKPPIPRAGMTITKEEAFRILASDLAEREATVSRILGPVPQTVFDGAMSFHFNTGAITRASWVAAFKRGDMREARRRFMLYNKPREIIGRRTREADLIFEGKYRSGPPMPVEPVRPQPDDPGPIPDPLDPDVILDDDERSYVPAVIGIGAVFAAAIAVVLLIKFVL